MLEATPLDDFLKVEAEVWSVLKVEGAARNVLRGA